jgi:hypothetical protein
MAENDSVTVFHYRVCVFEYMMIIYHNQSVTLIRNGVNIISLKQGGGGKLYSMTTSGREIDMGDWEMNGFSTPINGKGAGWDDIDRSYIKQQVEHIAGKDYPEERS